MEQPQTKRMKSGWLFIVVILALLLVLLPGRTAQGAAASTCQCVDYVKNRFKLTGVSGNAKDFGAYLSKNGFKQVYKPKVGAVAVMQPEFGQYVSSYGHVSVITAVGGDTNNWQITTVGANQGATKVTGYNCSNVGTVKWGKYPKSWGATKISYWMPPK
jgi:hypothetical protein